jgi:hypothetical protein
MSSNVYFPESAEPSPAGLSEPTPPRCRCDQRREPPLRGDLLRSVCPARVLLVKVWRSW